MNLGSFLNEYVSNSTVFWTLAVAVFFLLLIFGYFYNRLMDALIGKEHLSLYVAGGVLITIGAAALFSWKAGLLMLALFAADGLPMVVGEFKRTHRHTEERKKNPRRKRIPYAANGRIDDATMALREGNRLLGMALKEKDPTARALQLATASHELNEAQTNLLELKLIQQIEE